MGCYCTTVLAGPFSICAYGFASLNVDPTESARAREAGARAPLAAAPKPDVWLFSPRRSHLRHTDTKRARAIMSDGPATDSRWPRSVDNWRVP